MLSNLRNVKETRNGHGAERRWDGGVMIWWQHAIIHPARLLRQLSLDLAAAVMMQAVNDAVCVWVEDMVSGRSLICLSSFLPAVFGIKYTLL